MIQGQHALLLGESGSGKTTLLHLLSGLLIPTSGTVKLMEQNLSALRGGKLDAYRANNMGFIFQEAHLLRNLTVQENIKLAQSLSNNSVDEISIYNLLAELQISDKAGSLPNQLSRGQKQRVAIARAIINRPSLLLADEPTAALDDKNTELVMQLLFDLANNYGSTLLIATHDKRIKDHFENTYQL
ncbi:Methionine ABC transporter ATP-binding protein [Sphingobacterium sp. JB170]|nr:Methionine ABC transporter ATP-binding protein [Sphingobacterium sp. JB170]